MTFPIEKLNGPSLLGSESYVVPRKNVGNASNTMRKYQQLALAIVSVISLVAFLFYKHEYDRLRYTLEYLEMFGPPPGDEGLQNSLCGNTVHRRLTTVPAVWLRISDDTVVYSSFWDEGSGFSNPVIRTLAVVKKSREPPLQLEALISFDSTDNKKVRTDCSVEEMKERNHSKISPPLHNDLKLVYIVCQPITRSKKAPYMIEFHNGNEALSSPVLIQESETWKSVPNATAACVYSHEIPSPTSSIIEFIAFHSSIGVEKFTFFGPLLTPLTRKLLDKYSDESGLFYEEETFIISKGFELSDEQKRTIIENDCLYRHRDTHENVIILRLNQFLMPRTRLSVQGILSYLPSAGGRISGTIGEFHFITQRVCLDESHTKQSDLLLDSQARSISVIHEGVSLVRPHLITGTFSSKLMGASNEQNIPLSVASILSYETCSDEKHSDVQHLPTNTKFAEQVRKTLLYRKWKINS